MDAIIVLTGFFIGLAIFFCVMEHITAIIYNCSSVAVTFLICWGIGIVLAWIAWKIAIIVGIIALILYIAGKIFKPSGSGKSSSGGETAEKEENKEEA